jgi:ribosomal protein L21
MGSFRRDLLYGGQLLDEVGKEFADQIRVRDSVEKEERFRRIEKYKYTSTNTMRSKVI